MYIASNKNKKLMKKYFKAPKFKYFIHYKKGDVLVNEPISENKIQKIIAVLVSGGCPFIFHKGAYYFNCTTMTLTAMKPKRYKELYYDAISFLLHTKEGKEILKNTKINIA